MVTTPQYKQPPPVVLKPRARYTAVIATAYGDLTVELLTQEAPLTVNNFVFLAREGFYKDSSFHRVLKGSLVQGGCPEGDGTGYPGYHIQDEEAKRPYVKGIVAMASQGRDKNGSQFFIVHGDRVGFPPNYTIFGRLTGGSAVLDRLAEADVEEDHRGELSRPKRRLRIHDITAREDGLDMRKAAPGPAQPTATSPAAPARQAGPGLKARLRQALGIKPRPKAP